MTYVAAIDQGTTGTRFMIFDHAGKVVSSHYEEHQQIYPQPGWVEHDAREIWEKTRAVVSAALQKGNVRAADLAAIGVTNQRETTVVWNPKTGEPYHHAIVWQDTRSQAICQRLIDAGKDAFIRSKTGLPIATYFSAPKIQWLLENVGDLRAKAERGEAIFGTIDSWLIWNFTGGIRGGAHITDYTNASRTMLLNLQTLDWDDELLALFNIPRAMLPQLRASSDPNTYGTCPPSLFRGGAGGEVGIPVCGDLGDQQAALFGQVAFEPGEAKNTYGTGCFMLMSTGTEIVPSKSGLLTTVASSWRDHAGGDRVGGEHKGSPLQKSFALEGSIAIAGAAVQWLRDNLKIISNAAETEEIAQSVEDTGGVYFVPAFNGLFAPHWDMYARGTLVGLTRYTTRAHIVRATLEAICFQTREVLEAMEKDVQETRFLDPAPLRFGGLQENGFLKTLKVDGGAVKNNFLMQLQADILGTRVVRPIVNETTALGAAYAAGLAVGFWKSREELKENWSVDREFVPAWGDARRAESYRGWKRAVERAKGWLM
ncbi:MAG: glycerol kinase GlpK [Chloroflexi bacterium]|nr:glycerol kinase GlpK [Chloroflexota bacterium]